MSPLAHTIEALAGARAACYPAVLVRNLHPIASSVQRAPRALGFGFFWGWYFADGAKEAAPA